MNATATCDGTSCGYACNPGHRNYPSGCCAWTLKQVADSGTVDLAFALDRTNTPHIIHGRADYSYLEGGTFQTTKLPQGYYEIRNLALAVEPSGKPHLAFGGTTINGDPRFE